MGLTVWLVLKDSGLGRLLSGGEGWRSSFCFALSLGCFWFFFVVESGREVDVLFFWFLEVGVGGCRGGGCACQVVGHNVRMGGLMMRD